MKGVLFFYSAIILFGLSVACKNEAPPTEESPEPILLAQVFSYKLYFSDIEELIQGYENERDSIQQVRTLTEHWVRDRLILVEAEKKFPKEVNMAKLLEDYRQSLLRHFFEQKTLEEQLDTVITEEDLQAYYEANQELHRLPSGILRGYCFKFRRPASKKDNLLKLWKGFPDKTFNEVLAYAQEHAITNWSDSTEWHEMKMVTQLFPEGTLSPGAIRSNQSVLREDREYMYLLYPLEVYQENDIAPLDRIREHAARFILHQRELELLEKIKKEIYDRDIQNERVKIYNE
jgi:hypothetical protein